MSFHRKCQDFDKYLTVQSNTWSTKNKLLFWLGELSVSIHLGLCCSSLKIWTVSVLLEAHRNCASALKDNELMLTYLTRRQQTAKDIEESTLLSSVYFDWKHNKNFLIFVLVNSFWLNYMKVWVLTFSSLAGIQTASVLQECWRLW